jgi:hypothetical protein
MCSPKTIRPCGGLSGGGGREDEKRETVLAFACNLCSYIRWNIKYIELITSDLFANIAEFHDCLVVIDNTVNVKYFTL